MFLITALLIFGIMAVALLGRIYARSIFLSKQPKQFKQISRHISLNEWEAAQKLLIPLLKRRDLSKELALLEVQILHGTGKLSPALKQVQKASRLYPEELLFRLEEGKILLALNRSQEALAALKVCTPILRGESDLFLLAQALYQAGFSERCLDLLAPWVQSTQSGQLVALCADAYVDQKRLQEAITLYLQAMQLGFKHYPLFLRLAHAYRRLGNLAEAEKIFRRLIEKEPRNVEATLGLGLCLQERGHFQKALLVYQSGEVWELHEPRLMLQAGLCALRTHKYPFAQACLSVLTKQEGSEPQVFIYLGLSLECQKKWQEAEQLYLKMIQLFPTHQQGYRALGWLFGVGLSQTLSLEQGLSFAYRAVKLKNDPLTWEIISACYARGGNFEKAYRIQKALEEYDQEPETKARRQQSLRKLRQGAPLEDHHIVRSLVA